MAKVVDIYYDHVEMAIRSTAAWGTAARIRVGHINVIEKFRLVLPEMDQEQIRDRLTRLLPTIKEHAVGIDVNTSGLRKTTCGIPYVPEWFIQECITRRIPLVYGSDAHHPHDVGKGWEWFAAQVTEAD
jgi:histidinol-phosphatase (PHP family)